MNVSQIYDAEEDEPVEMKIDLDKKEAAHWGGFSDRVTCRPAV
jgi:hypothetical protein